MHLLKANEESFRGSKNTPKANLDPKKCPRAEPEAWTLRVVVDRRRNDSHRQRFVVARWMYPRTTTLRQMEGIQRWWRNRQSQEVAERKKKGKR